MKKRTVCIGSSIVLACVGLSGCATNSSHAAPAQTSHQQAAASTTKPRVITVAYQQFGNPPYFNQEWLQQAAQQFEKQYHGVTVKLEPIEASENDFYTKIDLMMKSASTAPDVVTEDTFLINADGSAGYLQPLNAEVKSWPDWSEFSAAMKSGSTSNSGEVYGVPYSTDTRGLYYDVKIFKEAGLPVPWHPKNWNDVLNAAKKIKEKVPGVVPLWMQVGKATGEATTMQTFEMLLYGTHDTLYDAAKHKWIVQSPGFLNSLKWIQTVYADGLGPSFSQILNAQAGNIESQQLMPQQKIGIALDGNWLPGSWQKNGPSPWPDGTKAYQLTAMPTEFGQAPGYTSMSGGWALSISHLSQNKQLAWDFIKIATDKKNMEWYDVHQGNLAPRKDIANDPAYENAPGQFFKVATGFEKFTHFRPANSQYPSVSTQIQAAVEAVATGALTPEQAMQQYANNVQRIVGASNTETVSK
ncbi:sugar ABC transporter substrate-binding protein [Alicyclobacillus hesperidum subsp. aegles]|uniref:extracellular solute-binding protein n=1 Tax=Alicyclobacillus hesperidum TaxID=89784 RepID=UPI00072A1363|nr:extracellular solute-binding protein [Alicyclobacillus hesperidum]KRW91341.1 ABC transporter substrate-binding protein [Alicyclobacillus tengchongensis]GLG00144.1 sugar ABC transporter substrate-binding protein [Alicyclobacillus hesperidum subsp. aegles]